VRHGEGRGVSPPCSNVTQRFRKQEHLRRPADFRRVYERRCAASDAWLLIYACPNDLAYSRLGLSVSRKYGTAPARNRLRRLYREAFRLTRQLLPAGLDLVLVPRSPNEPGLEVLRQSLEALTRRLARRLSQGDKPTCSAAE
jgi:ribonuclease P protein component